MKLKHLAVAAAAAVAGPSLVMAAPAMAQDKPAATVPDAAPKDDTARSDHATTAVPKPAKTATVTRKAPQAQTPLPNGPQPKTSGHSTSGASATKETAAAKADSIMQGPEVTTSGIPKAGFRAGGAWTQLSVKVDNSHHRAVSDFTPVIAFHRDDKSLKREQIQVEIRHTDAAGHAVWTAAPIAPGHDASAYGYHAFGLGKSTVKQDAVSTIHVRVRITAAATPGRFDITSDGVSTTGGGYTWAPATWYTSRVTTATDDGGGNQDKPVTEGPKATLAGVPKGFVAGGDWQYLSLGVDNTGKKAVKELSVGLGISTVDDSLIKDRQIVVETYRTDAKGVGRWVRVSNEGDSESFYFGYELSRSDVAAGQKTTLKVRMRFTADAPTVPITLRAITEAYLGGRERMESFSPWFHSAILAPGTSTPPDTGSGSKPKPQTGGTTPITATHTTTQATGELAQTGTGDATTWALGAGTALVGMGAAFVAGTGRHRRRTN
uniref:Gram-positive cocci surface proteins LPxTG domain-containing protein n=1 Tax=Streptomyces sp. NBC_00003 TaxID=2903608 RepID=A0AAU2UW20_9ACTN